MKIQTRLKSFDALDTSQLELAPVPPSMNAAQAAGNPEIDPSSSNRVIKLTTGGDPLPFSRSQPEEEAGVGSLDGARVLIADDDLSIRTSLDKMLKAEGCAVDTAANGVEALQKYDPDRTDVVVLDFNMPEKNGWDTYARIVDLNPTQAVILISGEVRPLGWSPHGRSPVFMEKPIRVLTLLRCIRKILVEPAGTRRVRVALQTILARTTRPNSGRFSSIRNHATPSALDD